MKQIFFGLLACVVVALPAQGAGVTSVDRPGPDVAVAPPAVGNSSLCLDGMEMEPDGDDLVPMPASLDGSCSVSDDTIAT